MSFSDRRRDGGEGRGVEGKYIHWNSAQEERDGALFYTCALINL